MQNDLLARLATLRDIPVAVLVWTPVAAVAGIVFGVVQGWPFWALALVFVVVTAPVLTMETAWTWRHYGWLGLFYLLVITQGGHVIEHVAQVTQIHVLDTPKPDAHGIFGALDIEWVHVIWNTWVLVATAALALRFRRNPWIWVALLVAGWHETEHLYIITRYIDSGLPGDPGLLSRGGIFGGGLPIDRPDLHFFYNVVETTPIVVAFAAQLRRAHDEWIATAFPHLPEATLVQTSAQAQTQRFASGDTIVAEGETATTFHIVTRGAVEVVRDAPLREVRMARLGPAQFFGEIGLLDSVPRTATVRALTAVEVLTFDREAFSALVASDDATAALLRRKRAERRAADALS